MTSIISYWLALTDIFSIYTKISLRRYTLLTFTPLEFRQATRPFPGPKPYCYTMHAYKQWARDGLTIHTCKTLTGLLNNLATYNVNNRESNFPHLSRCLSEEWHLRIVLLVLPILIFVLYIMAYYLSYISIVIFFLNFSF